MQWKKAQEVQAKLQQYEAMEQRMRKMEDDVKRNADIEAAMQSLNDSALIKQRPDGRYEAIDSFEEQQQIIQRR